MSCEFTLTKYGKPSLILDGYRYRLHRQKNGVCSWVCLQEKREKCRGSVKTTDANDVMSLTEHTCCPNVAELEVKKKIEKCRQRVKEEVMVPVCDIYRDEMKELYERGYNFVSEFPKYDGIKTSLCRLRRAALGTQQNPTTYEDIHFPHELLKLPNGSSFLKIDDVLEGSRIIVFGGEEATCLLQEGRTFFLDGTFSSCAKPFTQLYTLHVDVTSSREETGVVPVLYALLPDKKEATYRRLVSLIRKWCPRWRPVLVKVDFEIAVWNVLKSEFPDCKISGCNFHFNQAVWRKVQDLGLTTAYKQDESIRGIIRMCAALALVPRDDVEDAWIMIMSEAPQDSKLTQFLDYFVDQWLDNSRIPVESWNVTGQRHRTNNVVEGWNNKLNRVVSRKHPNIYFLAQKLKELAIEGDFLKRQQDSGLPSKRRKQNYVELDARIDRILQRHRENEDLTKCLRALSFLPKF